MLQKRYLSDLLSRNKEWLLLRALNYAEDNSQFFGIPKEKTFWKNTINSLSSILCNSVIYHSNKNSNFTSFSIDKDNRLINSFALLEASTCIRSGLSSTRCLSNLKFYRKIYKELINSASFETCELSYFLSIIDGCFDEIEISSLEALEESRNKLINQPFLNNNSFPDNIEWFPYPAILIDNGLKLVGYNAKAINNYPFLFKREKDNLANFLDYKGIDELIVKISEFKLSALNEYHFELPIQTLKKNTWFAVQLYKPINSKYMLITFFSLEKWKNIAHQLAQEKKKAEESNKQKTTFLANMSHEIRTPMNAIVGFAELLSLSDPTDEERKEYLSLIRRSSSDLLNIIEDVIDIAKIELKQLKISYANTNIYELLKDLELIFSKELIKHKKLNVKIKISIPQKGKDLIAYTDPKRLKQVLSNLISNAIKFTTKGVIEAGFKLSQKKVIYFYVKDTGIGIPKEWQKNIFDRFVQVENGYSKNINGSGLGLTICKNIVQLLGGDISVSSLPEKGSNFYFTLPFVDPVDEKPKPTSIHHTDSLDISFWDKKILIAEDEENNFIYLREILKHSGAEIFRAKNGLEAISIAESKTIDIILMDIKMPKVNGIEATQYIRQIKPNLPVIALTAFSRDEDKKNCLASGCIGYYSKPVQRDELINILVEQFSNSLSNAKKNNIDLKKKERV